MMLVGKHTMTTMVDMELMLMNMYYEDKCDDDEDDGCADPENECDDNDLLLELNRSVRLSGSS